jgi:hypothetical protein
MSVRDSFLILAGWVVLCVASGSLVTLVAKVLPG